MHRLFARLSARRAPAFAVLQLPFSLFTVAIAALLVTSFPLQAGSRDVQWKQVEEAIKKGLPKTAITNLEPIIQGALKDRAYAEAVKAIGKKIALEGNIQGNKPEQKIERLEAEIAKSPKEMVPLLDALLANWYWHYFQQNKWRFMQRTATAAPPGKDFTTWDLPRIFAEIDKQFRKALGAEKILKATPISSWNDLLEKGTMPDSYRPTLYDFIAHEALEFYTSGEQAAAKPEDAFELAADSPALDSSDKFLAWWRTFPTRQLPDSPIIKALTLQGALMAFHEKDSDPTAFLDVDLNRLTYAWNTAFGETKNDRYKAALKAFVGKWADHELSALARERWARVLQQEGELVAARQIALEGAQAFPKTVGGRLCRNVVTAIESKSASVTAERVWNAPWPDLTVRYRNIGAVYFRAIPYDWTVFLEKRRHRPENLNDKERREILARKPALEWSAKLPATTDYKEKTFTTPAPGGLKPSYYFIAASHDPKFGETDNVISMTDVWVSSLALVTRTRDGKIEGFVLVADSGEPVSGAQVAVWHLDNQGNRIADPTLTTDENGFFSLKPSQNRGYLFRARHNGQELATANDIWSHDRQNWQARRQAAQTVFFTDRAVYRPGQTIQYKGICLWVDQTKDDYEVLKGEELTVLFKDVNGKEIARQAQRANDYGSFAGSFTAPRDRLMGAMSLSVEGRAQGTAHFRVEEYKRPKFEVTLDAPKTAAKLNEKVALTGHAMNYTGAAVDGAAVKYRVVREVQMPWWWGWWRGGQPLGESQEIAHGTVRTGTDGSFKIEFTAKPDPKVPEKDEPTFMFQINADVTDSAGETRSADRVIRVGYTALEATISADDWQTDRKPVELKLETKTLDGEPQVAEGSLKVYALQAPQKMHRPPLFRHEPWRYGGEAGESEPRNDLSNPNNWPLGKVVAEKGFTTDTNGMAKVSFELAAGAYRAVLETQDRFGKKVTGRLPLRVLKPEASKLEIKVPWVLAAPDWELQPGEEFMALWGTGYDTGRAFIEIEHRREMIQRYWTKPGATQQQIKLAVTEAMRGGCFVHVTFVRENRACLESRKISVPWQNKVLDLKWEHFVSKLQPGQKETWTLEVRSPKTEGRSAERTVAELVATLYDESLDAFAPLSWPGRFSVFREDSSYMQPQFGNGSMAFRQVLGGWHRPRESVAITYRSFPPDLTANLWGYDYFGRVARRAEVTENFAAARTMDLRDESLALLASPAPAAAMAMKAGTPSEPDTVDFDKAAVGGASGAGKESPAPKPDLSQVAARKNLNETAFFFPQLTSDSNGVVRLTFTMPEALTKWRFLGFAHDRSMRSGLLEDHAVTAKDLMVQPNPPRFLREDDTVEFTVKVSNQTDKPLRGTVRLTFNEAQGRSGVSPDQGQAGRLSYADKLLGNSKPEQDFDIPAKESRSCAWRIHVPDGCGFLAYKAVGAAANVSDGEEGNLPVLSRRILVTESLPLPIRGPATTKFEFARLLKSGGSKTLQNQNLVVQMVSNPAWYAVLALPYLMEYPYECTEQTFNRLYANALARTIANSDPRIRRIFDQWKNTPALESPLQKNQDLKAVMIEETPWLRQAANESQARKNVGILFDDNRLNYEIDATLRKLTEQQLNDGSWPWFPGGQGNDYITLYITTGFGRLRRLGADIDVAPAIRSLQRLDGWMAEHYERIRSRPEPEKYVPSSTDALYLYGRSFFLKDRAIEPQHKAAINFFLQQSRKLWLKTDCRQTQGHLALALQRFNSINSLNDSTPRDIMKSIKERSVSNEEMGMFWRETELSWWWYRAPIETQALMIEAFDEVMGDQPAVEDCRVWLLKQKQTQDWKTTKATADAVYALLLRGRDILSSDALAQVKLDGVDVTPAAGGNAKSEGRSSKEVRNPKSDIRSQPEAGTGFYEYRFAPAEIKPKLGEITVKKVDQGVAWGSVNWQYLEDISKVTPYEGTPLKLNKSLFTKVNTAKGPVLEPVKGPVKVGDELVVRIELRVDRDMEYVHLKDQRGSGTEPVNVLSRYKYQDGLAYYESTRDVASHFFIDYLPKGAYVFEYSTRVQLRGQYQTGMAQIQCMYAPEFNSHSQSLPLVVN
ncbi:MAG TPA: alpha-2-macroglobulin family protein [Candidatus Paceibacterota bacterium]|nr:alpha-2-macroglobulin family protein [Verrucomicrobiota bacterium]HSA09593.1 alpha-2-macroglobulin family protein [Candidatus Paceibacterota bacterium]